MIADSVRTLAFEFLPERRVIVSYQTMLSPSDAEWQNYLEVLSAITVTELVKVFVQTDGGRPSPEQQQRLFACLHGRDLPAAVVSPKVAVRFVVSSLALSQRNVRYFEPDNLAGAFEYLQLDGGAQLSVQHALQRLRDALGASAPREQH